jgi:hypothetical protein
MMKMAALGIGDQVVPIPAHIGLLYDAEPERHRMRLEFLRPALEDRREGIMLLVPPRLARGAVRDLEADIGGSLDSEVRIGRVVVAHYRSDPDLLLENIRSVLDALAARRFGIIRVFAQVAWGAPGFPLPEDHLWAESRLNNVLADTRVIMVCAYDVSQLPDWALVTGALETHPRMVIGGRLADNPNYLAPPEYMRSLLLNLSPPGEISGGGHLE